MDDQLGNVIDGTARARHWRRSTSKTRPADGTEARSDAPKSFAGSLLVPAEMLTAAPAEEPLVDRAEQSRTQAALPSTAAGPADLAALTGTHQNPFLVPDAAQVRARVRPARLPLARVVGRVQDRRNASLAVAVLVIVAAATIAIASVIGGGTVKARRSPVPATSSTLSSASQAAAKARTVALATRAHHISDRDVARARGHARHRRDVAAHRAAANRQSAVEASASPPPAVSAEAPGSTSPAGSSSPTSNITPPSANESSAGGAAASTGSAQPAGPAGTAAGTVGSNCNPKCS
jgi:hypothetical protein